MKLFTSFLFSLFLFIQAPQCQNISYKIRTIAFYNVENLFDTINSPDTFDEDFTPKGRNHYSSTIYRHKIENIGKVISQIGKKKANSPPAIIGLAEVENISVLKDLIQSSALKNYNYQIIHQDSPDLRGIDVAFLYRENAFQPIHFESFEVKLWEENGQRIYTRDQLLVSGFLDDELVHIIVNHWPSRRGGKIKSESKREKAAYVLQTAIDKIRREEKNPKMILMGDFNDDPTDRSIKNGLKSVKDVNKVNDSTFYNPMESMFQKGMNTLGYRDKINLFDQILLSSNCITPNHDFSVYQFYKAGVFNPKYLIQQKGKYKGYPYRSFQNSIFTGGFSDHFPVYIYLIKKQL